jgi:biotin operon repressor
MAIKWISWAFEADCPSPTSKLVLIKLADNANDAGTSFPSMANISHHTGLSRRAVIDNIKKLESAGLLEVIRRREGDVNLVNHYRLIAAPVVQEIHQGSEPVTLGVVQEMHPEPSIRTVIEPTPPSGESRAKEKTNARGTRLPEDWEPTAEQRQYALDEGCDPDATFQDFREHWLAKAGAGARKANWNLTWQTWCRREKKFSRGGSRRSDPSVVEAGVRLAARLSQRKPV